MIENKVRTLWNQGKPVLNGWLSIGNSFVAEIMAAQGYDSITVDIQHGALDYNGALPMIQAMRASNVAIGARVPWLDPAMIMKVLDAGALTVICPMVNSGEQAAEFASYVRYPPGGQRSFGPTRAAYAQGANIAGEANGQVVALAMIETATALRNVEDITETPGVDGVYIGPSDLALSIGNGKISPGFDWNDPVMVEPIKHILKAAKKAGKRAALHCGTPEYAARAIGWGFDMCTVSGDSRLLQAAASDSVARFRELTENNAGATDENRGGY
ncbi:MAG: aldolase/citrate lyase family protein [Roseovarius sp.]|nr:aldolase/citrate lyase family protein [Roseovarius sp.]MCY4206562.1 aldolase/citrate lyase family protein [Roseovarius sp.]